MKKTLTFSGQGFFNYTNSALSPASNNSEH